MTNGLRAFCRLVLGFLLGFSSMMARADDAPGDPAAEAFFETRVRPLLVGRCLECHGEAGKAKGGLRLDARESLIKGGDSGPAATPGKPDASLIISAIHYIDDPKMPPKGKLAADEIAILERWVKLGLPWPKTEAAIDPSMQAAGFRITQDQRRFWSFRPIRKVEPPQIHQADWPLNPIDQFILDRLEKEGLKPSNPADRRTLIRRVTFDLTGLPPTPEDVSVFLNDPAADAYEKVVDRLLASPAYGQRWGRHWLDVARYADSRDARGVGGDGDIGEAFRYRDWVVDALNKDLPYDQFIIQQVAGDLLPGPSPGDIDPDALVATGLLTIGEWGIGDADKEKMLTDIVADQVDVVTRGFLGLTVACARCHDHKFDPVSTADYYGLAGIFFSTKILPDPGPKTAGSPMLRTPLATRARKEAIANHQRMLEEADIALKKVRNEARLAVARALLPRLREALRAASDNNVAATDLPPHVVRKWAKTLQADTARRMSRKLVDVQGNKDVHFWSSEADNPWIGVNASAIPVSMGTLTLPPRTVNLHPGPRNPAAIRWKSPFDGLVNIEAKISDADPNGGNGVTAQVNLRKGRSTRELVSNTIDNGGRKTLEGGTLNGVEVKAGDVVELVVTPRGEYSFDSTTVWFKVDRSGENPATWDLTADVLPDLLKANPHADRQGHEAVWELVEIDPSKSPRPMANHPAWADWDKNQSIDMFTVLAESDPRFLEALVGPDGPFSPDLSDEAAVLSEPLKAEIARRQAEVARLKSLTPPPIPVALVAQEGGVPNSVYAGFHDARIQVRGDYRRLGAVVPRHVPEIVAGESAPTISGGSGRLELGRWIASPSNPLTARVMVNRLWQGHFGSGLVRTSSNFGKLGETPSHPELLDWLASRFINDGWSLKKMHRLMVTSQTYRQSSIDASQSRKVDPENRLLARMERKRLEAEAVRDSLLAVAGKLDPGLGGPSTRDFNSPRRTIYQMTIRSDRSSFGPLFDAADSTAMVDRRVVSTVAPQALFLMNHPFVLEQARALGGRLQKEAPNDEDRIKRAYELLYARPPTADELTIGRELIEAMTRTENSLERAWTAYAQVLLCANEFLYID